MAGAAGRRETWREHVRAAVAALSVLWVLASCTGPPGDAGGAEGATEAASTAAPSIARQPAADNERTDGPATSPGEPAPGAPSPAEPRPSGTSGTTSASPSPSPATARAPSSAQTANPPGATSSAAPPPGTSPPRGVPADWRGQDVEVLPTSEPVVALTFDAGASGAAVAEILDVLARYDVRATFFVTGEFARNYPSAVREIATAGHPVGNQSDEHPAFPEPTNEEIRAQLARAEEEITALTGRPARPLFRFPHGSRTPLDVRVVNNAGYVPFHWTVDTLGWQGTSGGRSADSVRDRVMSTARPGQIVLMHVGAHPTDGSTLDADALPAVIEGLRERGYRFVSLDQYF